MQFRLPALVAAALITLSLPATPASAQKLTWTKTDIGEGIKPAIAVDGNDVPHVAYLTELIRGATFYATNKSGAWKSETVATGYFYGPVDIDVTKAGVPYVVYHDHEAAQFNPRLGSGVLHWRDGDTWKEVRVVDRGHDQWDSDVAVSDDGTWHFAGVDPSQFNSRDGIEYVTNAFGSVKVEQVGSGPQPYEFGVSVEVAPNGAVGITYFDAGPQDLKLAVRTPGANGKWRIETVDAKGDAGRYADLAYDAAGNPHISYFEFDGIGGGPVKYATRVGSDAWKIETVGKLEAMNPGMIGARKLTNVEIDAQGVPHVMFGDAETIQYAVRVGGKWSSDVVFKRGDRAFGQLVEFALDSKGQPHLTYFEKTGSRPLNGRIIYAVGKK